MISSAAHLNLLKVSAVKMVVEVGFGEYLFSPVYFAQTCPVILILIFRQFCSRPWTTTGKEHITTRYLLSVANNRFGIQGINDEQKLKKPILQSSVHGTPIQVTLPLSPV